MELWCRMGFESLCTLLIPVLSSCMVFVVEDGLTLIPAL